MNMKKIDIAWLILKVFAGISSLLVAALIGLACWANPLATLFYLLVFGILGSVFWAIVTIDIES